MVAVRKITVKLTPYQMACAAEASSTAILAVSMPVKQAEATERAGDLLEKALRDAGYPWPLD